MPSRGGISLYRDETLDPPALVCVVGTTELRDYLRCLDDLHCSCDHALLSNSPAIDAGDTNGCTTGLRRFRRPIGPRCDIGAVEYSPDAIDLPLVQTYCRFEDCFARKLAGRCDCAQPNKIRRRPCPLA